MRESRRLVFGLDLLAYEKAKTSIMMKRWPPYFDPLKLKGDKKWYKRLIEPSLKLKEG